MFEMSVEDFVREVQGGARAILQVRHAERPKMDPDDPTFGDSLPLTPEGVRTAKLMGEKLRPLADSVQFVSSPLRRTVMTARGIAEGMGLAGAEIPTDGAIGNDSFYYEDTEQVLDVFKPENFFNACFEYMRTGRQRGFNELYGATDRLEEWLFERFDRRLMLATTHDLYIAVFLYARRAVDVYSKDNWPRFLDGAAILVAPDGSRRYASVRAGLSNGICGVKI